MSVTKVLFASTHCILDPSSGAALATRDILELLSRHGVTCRALCCGVLDYEQPTAIQTVLETLGTPYRSVEARRTDGFSIPVFDLEPNGVRTTIVPTASSRADQAPNLEESRAWLDLGEQALDRFRPDVLLTYGGHPAGLELMRRARRRGIAVVFHLHNFAYSDMSAFRDASGVLVPSEYARKNYARTIGVKATAIPYPLHMDRILATNREPKYVTFVNPQAAKGASVFARIALELQARRPEIPLLVVEGRGGTQGLATYGLDLSGLTNLSRMANTPDPRDFYRVSRVVLVPSLWRETFGRVAAEAMANGIPVLASDRGALPETLRDAGFVIHIPYKYGPDGKVIPDSRAVAPWIKILEKLWDETAFEAKHRERARVQSGLWNSDEICQRYRDYFSRISQAGSEP